jgi:hypothetical protein
MTKKVEKEKETPKPRKETRILKYLFTVDELREIASNLARECRELEQLEFEKKQVVSDFKAKIDAHNAQVSKLSAHINNGHEYRYIECSVFLNDPTPGKRTVIRIDNNETVAVEDMPKEEMQEDLFDPDFEVQE